MFIIFSLVVTLCSFSTSAYTNINTNDIAELQYLNKSVDPCDNFYQYICGNFKNVHPLPTGAQNVDHFTLLQDEIHKIATTILESERTNEDPIAVQKAKAMYTACTNVKYFDYLRPSQLNVINTLGDWPAITENFREAKLSWDDIGDIIGTFGVPLFFELIVTASPINATGNVIYLSSDPLTNPEAGIIGRIPQNFDYFSKPPSHSRANKNTPLPYEVFLGKIAHRLRGLLTTYKATEDMLRDISDTMKYIQQISNGGVIISGVNITSLPMETRLRDLQIWTDNHFGKDFGLNWVSFFSKIFKNTGVTIDEDMKTMQVSAKLIYGILNLYKMSSPARVKNYIFARLFTHMAPDSDDYMRNALKEFYIEYNYTIYERPEYCIRKTLGYPSYIDFSMAVTHEYQLHHFNVNKLTEAYSMIRDLEASFLEILKDAKWMDEQSRALAIKKADGIITLLGYPDYVEDPDALNEFYKSLKICTWDHFGNSQRLRAFRMALNLKEIENVKNRELWNISPLEVNAFYNRANNRILFPVSMLNPVFFNGDISLLDYARIGAVIGHEITHGFDKDGKSYGLEGTQTADWWSPETLAAFDKLTGCFEDQYGQYYIEEIDKYVNASQTLNENLADNGGLRAAFLAYKKLAHRKKNLKTLQEYTAEQLFFIGYGTMWCMTETPGYLDKMHASQYYSPGRYRVNGAVSNMKEFSEAFNCPVGSSMNRADKCVLW